MRHYFDEDLCAASIWLDWMKSSQQEVLLYDEKGNVIGPVPDEKIRLAVIELTAADWLQKVVNTRSRYFGL
jgi:hypothetical protein